MAEDEGIERYGFNMRGVVEMRFKVGDNVKIVKNLTLEDVGQVHDML